MAKLTPKVVGRRPVDGGVMSFNNGPNQAAEHVDIEWTVDTPFSDHTMEHVSPGPGLSNPKDMRQYKKVQVPGAEQRKTIRDMVTVPCGMTDDEICGMAMAKARGIAANLGIPMK